MAVRVAGFFPRILQYLQKWEDLHKPHGVVQERVVLEKIDQGRRFSRYHFVLYNLIKSLALADMGKPAVLFF